MAAKAKRKRYSPQFKAEFQVVWHGLNANERQAYCEKNQMTVEQAYALAGHLTPEANEGLDRSEKAAAENDRATGRAYVEAQFQLIRSDPETLDFDKRPGIDSKLTADWGQRTPEYLAFILNISETAALYRARHLKRPVNGEMLPLRRLTFTWDAQKVAAWFVMTLEELHAFEREGLVIVPEHLRNGRLKREVVTTMSLIRFIEDADRKQMLVERGADPFFLLELEETKQALLEKTDGWELCKHLSHGHVCMNTYAENSHGLFCTNNERYLAGDDPRCAVRNLKIHDLRPSIEEPDDDV